MAFVVSGEGVGRGNGVEVGLGVGEGLAAGICVASGSFARGERLVVGAASEDGVTDGDEDVGLFMGLVDGLGAIVVGSKGAGLTVGVGVGFTVTLSADLVGSGVAARAFCNCGDAAEARISNVSITLKRLFTNRCTDFILAPYVPTT